MLLHGAVPDVLVSGIGMAAEDGYASSARCGPSRGLARVPAVALTAYGHPADRAHALGAGSDRHGRNRSCRRSS